MSQWHERYGGYLLALAIHLLLLSLSVREKIAYSLPPPPDTMQLAMTFSMSESLPAPPESLNLPAAAATGDDAEENESPLTEMEDMEGENPAETETETEQETPAVEETETQETLDSSAEAEPDPREMAELAEEELIQRLLEEKRRLVASAQTQTRASLESELEAEKIRSKGREFLDRNYGDVEGAVRVFDIKGDPSVVNEIMARYGLRTVTGYVSPDDSGAGSYLSRAATNDGVYRPTNIAGRHEILEISPIAFRKLQTLERDEFTRRNLDPSRHRIVKIVFGIVRNESGWDLGVTSMDVESMD